MSNILDRVNKEMIDALNPDEREAVLRILDEITVSGSSNLYNQIIDEDYEELPVDIDTFIEHDKFIGKTTNNGKNIYPYWRNKLRTIFSPDHNFQEIIFTGAIGLGKTTIAIIGMTYILHRLLCLKNPQTYYRLQPNSTIVFVFFNISLDLSYGVAYGKLQSMLMESPWFLEHGTISGRLEKNKEFIPEKRIRFRIGSQEGHALGQDVFCVAGDTPILTIDGEQKISDIEGKPTFVYSEDKGEPKLSDLCFPMRSGYSDEMYRITFDNGVTREFTGDHRLRLEDGSYKCVKDITLEDELKSII